MHAARTGDRRRTTITPRHLAVAAALGAAVGLLSHCKRSGGTQGPQGEFNRYILRVRTSEAVERLAFLYRMMATYSTEERVGRGESATLTAPQLPASAPRTPDQVPRGVAVQTGPDSWAHPTWQALAFSMADPHRYSYEVITRGREFTLRAYGDLDGDGVLSTFERRGRLNESNEIEGSPEVVRIDELE